MDIGKITQYLSGKSLDELIKFNRQINSKPKTDNAKRLENFKKIEFGCGDKDRIKQQLMDYLNPPEEPKLFDLKTEEYIEKLRKQDIIERAARGEYVTPEERELVGEEEMQKAEQINAMRKAFAVNLARCNNKEEAAMLYMHQMAQVKSLKMSAGSGGEATSGTDFEVLYIKTIKDEYDKHAGELPSKEEEIKEEPEEEER